jgi:exodeoxyribonuclease VIII
MTTAAEYHRIKALSASLLKQALKSGAHAKAFEDGLFEETAAQSAGTLRHMLTTEPQRAEAEVAVWTEGDRRGKAWLAFQEANASKIIVKPDEMDEARAAARAVRGHPEAKALLAQGKPEVTVLWELDGRPAKSRPDWLSDSAIVDLKFSRDSSLVGWPREAIRFGAPLQAAFYTDAVKSKTGLELPFYFVVCEPGPVFAVTVFHVPLDIIELGRSQYRRALKTLEACRASGVYPAYSESIVELQLPQYAFTEEFQ